MGLRLQFWLRWFELLSGYTSTGTAAAAVGISFFFSAFSPGWVGLGLGVFGVWRFFVLLFVLSFTGIFLVWFDLDLDGMG